MPSFFRVFVEKKLEYSVKTKNIFKELKSLFTLPSLDSVRIITFYEISGLSGEEGLRQAESILSEPPSDIFSTKFEPGNDRYIAAEYLPGQFDQRADSAKACFSLVHGREDINVRSGQILVLAGEVSDREFERIKNYWINPVEMREKSLESLKEPEDHLLPGHPEILEDFFKADKTRLEAIISAFGFSMDIQDMEFVRQYFLSIGRAPYVVELRVIDTYWSDHCRHRTFETELSEVVLPDGDISAPLKDAWKTYLEARSFTGREEKPITLMDIATIWSRVMQKSGKLEDLEVSGEVNAASIRIKADTPHGELDWLLMFKNETHNHPTEIEPFGGASTCIGGAIRDPLSGRAYVYQGVRVTGSGDPTVPLESTLKGKLPQRYITTRAAAGYSSYGNQIGLATSYVREIYDNGYIAKRMEVGAVVAGVPEANVRREKPLPGDTVLVVGGATGRDGCGGATGSSKSHSKDSIHKAGAEVQKGNAPEERKLQRLFRNPKAASMIKRCNDFGAGGACVAMGELSSGIRISLDALPVKYQGLSAEELAISESQERMAVVVSPENAVRFMEIAHKENLSAVKGAEITGNGRLTMEFFGQKIVEIERKFLDTNGLPRKTNVTIGKVPIAGNPLTGNPFSDTHGDTSESGFKSLLVERLKKLDIAGRRGLVGMFDSTVGANTVLLPLGGKYQGTEAEASVHLLPLAGTTTASVIASGFNPVISKWSPFHGAVYAFVEALSRIAATGARWRETRFSFQEYFPSPGDKPELWGLPLASLLGGLWAQKAFGLPSIGGKDSMSGTFEDISVPPTLVAFGVTTATAGDVISPEFKTPGNLLYYFSAGMDKDFLPSVDLLTSVFDALEKEITAGTIVSAWSIKEGGLAEGLAKMSFGNRLGARISLEGLDPFAISYGSFIVESKTPLDYPFAIELGMVFKEWNLEMEYNGKRDFILLEEIYKVNEEPLEDIFPPGVIPDDSYAACENVLEQKSPLPVPPQLLRKIDRRSTVKGVPRVLIPVFYGTNCEYESSEAFEREGADTSILVFRNRSSMNIKESIDTLAGEIKKSQILFLPGGFSAGDEPDGSGKYIVSVLKNPLIMEAVNTLLDRGGLILGICNGFQALIKSGLLPWGKIGLVDESSPTLVENTVGRHISMIAPTRYTGAQSPWLAGFTPGEIHHLPFSHGEGRFKAPEYVLDKLFEDSQVAFQYSDLAGNPVEGEKCINGSDRGIEGIISPDGRILGKMGHSERYRSYLYKNYPDFKVQNIFASGVKYFKQN